jgi:hypothetical protein
MLAGCPSGGSPSASDGGGGAELAQPFAGDWRGTYVANDGPPAPITIAVDRVGPQTLSVSDMCNIWQLPSSSVLATVLDEGRFAIPGRFSVTRAGDTTCTQSIGCENAIGALSGDHLHVEMTKRILDLTGCYPDQSWGIVLGLDRLPPLVTPSNLQVDGWLAWDWLHVTWTPGEEEAIQTRYAIGAGLYRELGDVQWSRPGAFDLSIGQEGELEVFSVEVRGVRGPRSTPWSDPVPWWRPISPPGSLEVNLAGDALNLSWKDNSLVATSVLIERAKLDGGPGDPPSDWQLLWRFPADRVSVVDAIVEELTSYAYRVTYARDSVLGTPAVQSCNCRTSLHPPTLLSVDAGPGSADLTWVNHSILGTGIAVLRADGDSPESVVASLPATARSFHDGPLDAGVHAYQLQVSGAGTTASSNTVVAVVPP